jgi:uncharacterized protein
MDRRQFAKHAALVPHAIAVKTTSVAEDAKVLDASNSAQQNENHKAVERKRKSAAEYNKHPPIHESEPFSGPLTFLRSQACIQLQPFALGEVQLGAGPFQQARDLNRAYMMRLPNERLLHNFRINAGLSSNAAPLGGWKRHRRNCEGISSGIIYRLPRCCTPLRKIAQ